MNKEECQNKLKNLKKLQKEINKNCEFNSVANSVFIGAIKCFEELIKEHFENPPLKWEDIHEDTWIWDNKECEYAFLDKAYLNDKNEKKIRVWSGMKSYWYIFEENRFYRKQVEE